MQTPHKLIFCAHFAGLALLLTAGGVSLQIRSAQATLTAAVPSARQKQPAGQLSPLQKPIDKRVSHSAIEKLRQRAKTEAAAGEYIGPMTDCDGDGIANESRIDFDGDGVADECVEGREEIPEPPFQQAYTPTPETFYSLIPAVGWQAQYQCGDGLYDVTLSRPTEGSLAYAADGLQLTSDVVYDDIDPNLNQPLVIKDPVDGLRYSFQQRSDGEFYEYAIANYGGSVGLYVYQTGEQVVAVPCETTATGPSG